MKVSSISSLPPRRLLRGCIKGWEWVNEYELVDWYTEMGRKYKEVKTEITWFDKIFMPEHKRKLLKSLEENANV